MSSYIEANTLPKSQASFGELFYSSSQDIAETAQGAEVHDSGSGHGKLVCSAPTLGHVDRGSESSSVAPLDNIVLNCNTKKELLSINRWKLNRQLKDALVIEGVIEKNAVRNCLKTCVSSATEVEIHLPKNKSKSTLKNVHTCKNFWQCPVCRGNALHKKRQDIHAVIERSKSTNIMATFTLRHTKDDSLISMIEGLQKASSDLWRDRVWQALKKKYQFEWNVRNLEVTWGKENGWHTHIHLLIGSLSDAIDIAHIEHDLFTAWDRLVQKYGLKALDRQAGVNVVSAESADDYLIKWSIKNRENGSAYEMAGEKSGRGNNVSMGELEVDVLAYQINPNYQGYTTEAQTKYLLKEYHQAFARRKFLQPGGKYNEILGQHKKQLEEKEIEECEEEIKEDKSVVFVKGSFWSRLSYGGLVNGWLSELEERGVTDGMDWLLSKVKDHQVILDNVRVEEYSSDPSKDRFSRSKYPPN